MNRYIALTIALLSSPASAYRMAPHKIMRAPINADQAALQEACSSYTSIDQAVTELSALAQDATWNNRIENESDFLITLLGTQLGLDTRLVGGYLAHVSPAAHSWVNNHLTSVDQTAKNNLLAQLISIFTGSEAALGVASWLASSGAQPQSVTSAGTLSLIVDSTYHRLLVEDSVDHGIKAIILDADPSVSGITINPNQRLCVYFSQGALLKFITIEASGSLVQEVILSNGTPNQLEPIH